MLHVYVDLDRNAVRINQQTTVPEAYWLAPVPIAGRQRAHGGLGDRSENLRSQSRTYSFCGVGVLPMYPGRRLRVFVLTLVATGGSTVACSVVNPIAQFTVTAR